MRILVVDDHEVVRKGLSATLMADPRYRVVGGAGTGKDALTLARRTRPDLALVDLLLPDMTGVELCRRLRALVPAPAVVMLTTYLNERVVRDALSAGACAYVTKSAGIERLREALETVEGGAATPEHPAQIVKRLHEAEAAGDAWRATPQQRRVLELAAQGLTDLEVGERMFISRSTVRFHVQKLKQQLGARTRTELIAKAIQAGVVPPAPEDVAAR